MLDLFLVGLHDIGVDMISLAQVGVGNCNHNIDFAALQLGTDAVAEIQFGKAQLVGQLHLKVQLFAVQRLDFDSDFLLVKRLFGYAIASHGTYHNS